MKKLLLILIFFITINSIAQNKPSRDLIGTPFKIGYLEIAQYDFPEKMRWFDASNACINLGEGWRLPDQNELDLIYNYASKIENLTDNYYWSSFVYNSTISEDVWRQRIGDGQTYSARPDGPNNKHSVRAVRTDPKATAESIIQTFSSTIKFGFLEIAQSDFKDPMDLREAEYACFSLGNGWRLPTKEDLNTIFIRIPYRFKWFPLNGFIYNYYWGKGSGIDIINENISLKSKLAPFKWRPANYTSGQYKTIGGSAQYNFEDSYTSDKHIVRPVRTITSGTPFNFVNKEVSNKEASKVIGKPIVDGKLEISQFEFSEEMDQYDAERAVKILGKGWRLPSYEELKHFYNDRDKFDDFGNEIYLTQGNDVGFNFENGKFGTVIKPHLVRAVRTIK